VCGLDQCGSDAGCRDDERCATNDAGVNYCAARGSCSPDDCGGQASNGSGWCDDTCFAHENCADQIAEVCGFDQCGSDEGCRDDERCATSGEGLNDCVDVGG
jgi:hypothetical protein